MLEYLEFAFVQNAVFASVLTSILCGVIGTLIVVNRMAMLTGGIAHAAYGGVGLATYFALPILPMTLAFGMLSGLVMAVLSRGGRSNGQERFRSDVTIGVIWAGGMAFGILLLDAAPGYNVDLMSYLFGGILSVSRDDLWLMAGLTVCIILLVAYGYQSLISVSFDADFAETRGVPVRALHYLLVAMAAVVVVMTIRVVGLILVVALVSIPASIALEHSRSFFQMMCVSSLLSLSFMLLGLAVSMAYDLPAGGMIIAIAVLCFAVMQVYTQIQNRHA